MDTDSNVEKNSLHDWIEYQTRALDVVASWESLCDAYRSLEFTDQLSDSVKLEEFKWIIKQMNSFLTKMRKKLLSCRNLEITKEALMNSFTPVGKVTIDGRRSLAYQKLRQRWIMQMIAAIEQLEIEQEGSSNGWSDGNDAYESE